MTPAIMVIPNGGKRSEYRDWEPQKVLPETFIIRELIPYIDANYRTIKDRRGRWVEGMSMGGNGSLKFALKFPDLFSSVVAYAGSYEPLPKDGFLYPGVAPEFRGWLITLAKWYTPDHDPFELAKFNRYRLNGLRIRLVGGTADVALKDSEAMHKYFQEIGVVHEYGLFLGIPHNQTLYYERARRGRLSLPRAGLGRKEISSFVHRGTETVCSPSRYPMYSAPWGAAKSFDRLWAAVSTGRWADPSPDQVGAARTLRGRPSIP